MTKKQEYSKKWFQKMKDDPLRYAAYKKKQKERAAIKYKDPIFKAKHISKVRERYYKNRLVKPEKTQEEIAALKEEKRLYINAYNKNKYDNDPKYKELKKARARKYYKERKKGKKEMIALAENKEEIIESSSETQQMLPSTIESVSEDIIFTPMNEIVEKEKPLCKKIITWFKNLL